MRQGYVGIVLMIVFSLFAFAFFSFPDLRFYRDFTTHLENVNIPVVYSFEDIDVDDFLSASVLSLGAYDSSIGLSFDEFGALRRNKREAKKIRNLIEDSGWKFTSTVLGNLFTPLSGERISAFIPNLSAQIDSGIVSPDIFVVEGKDLRSVWSLIAEFLSSQIDISYLDIIW